MTVLLRLSAASSLPTPALPGVTGVTAITLDLHAALAPHGLGDAVCALDGSASDEPVVVLRPARPADRAAVLVQSLRRALRRRLVVDLPHGLGPLGELRLAERVGHVLASDEPDLDGLATWSTAVQAGLVDVVWLRSRSSVWAVRTGGCPRLLAILPGARLVASLGADPAGADPSRVDPSVGRPRAALAWGVRDRPMLALDGHVTVGAQRPASASALVADLTAEGAGPVEVLTLPRGQAVAAEVVVERLIGSPTGSSTGGPVGRSVAARGGQAE